MILAVAGVFIFLCFVWNTGVETLFSLFFLVTCHFAWMSRYKVTGDNLASIFLFLPLTLHWNLRVAWQCVTTHFAAHNSARANTSDRLFYECLCTVTSVYFNLSMPICLYCNIKCRIICFVQGRNIGHFGHFSRFWLKMSRILSIFGIKFDHQVAKLSQSQGWLCSGIISEFRYFFPSKIRFSVFIKTFLLFFFTKLEFQNFQFTKILKFR